MAEHDSHHCSVTGSTSNLLMDFFLLPTVLCDHHSFPGVHGLMGIDLQPQETEAQSRP